MNILVKLFLMFILIISVSKVSVVYSKDAEALGCSANHAIGNHYCSNVTRSVDQSLHFLNANLSNNLENIKLNQYCCKRCITGKACGDSCISRSKTCHQGPGCACEG